MNGCDRAAASARSSNLRLHNAARKVTEGFRMPPDWSRPASKICEYFIILLYPFRSFPLPGDAIRINAGPSPARPEWPPNNSNSINNNDTGNNSRAKGKERTKHEPSGSPGFGTSGKKMENRTRSQPYLPWPFSPPLLQRTGTKWSKSGQG